MQKLTSLFSLFRQGEAVANPAAWHNGQITATVLGALIIAAVNVLAAFGHPLPVDTDSANSIGAGILAIVNVVFTATGSPHVGLSALPAVQGADSATETGVQPVNSTPVPADDGPRQRGQR